jgi:hypothetical protein
LENELDSPTGQHARGGFLYAIYEIFFLTYFSWFSPSVKNQSQKSVQVKALDFDWIFDGQNTIRLLDTLQNSADEDIWDKKSIKALIELVWQQYRPVIIKRDFIPYTFITFMIVMLLVGYIPFANIQLNQVRCIKMLEDVDLSEMQGDTCQNVLVI